MKIAQFLAVALVVLGTPALAAPLEVFPVHRDDAAEKWIQVDTASFTSLQTESRQGRHPTGIKPILPAADQPVDSEQGESIELLAGPFQDLTDEVGATLSRDAPVPSVGGIFALTLSGLIVIGRNKQQDR